jgi:nitrogen regulatory protein PII
MKLIVALVRPEKLNAVLSALNSREVYLLSVSDVVCAGRGPHNRLLIEMSLLRVEVASSDSEAEEVVESITRAHGPAEPGQAGGKVFAMSLEEFGDLKNDKFEPVGIGS